MPAQLAAQKVPPIAVPVANDALPSFEEAFPLNATATPVVQPIPGLVDASGNALGEIQHWTVIDARGLYIAISGIRSEGLDPADYDRDGLQRAIDAGPGPELDRAASERFRWLVEDLRDGRTPMEARKQWFVVDPDRDRFPTAKLMADALASHDFAGVVDELAPTHPDYAALREALAQTPPEDTARIALIRANMDRWRWLARDLGAQYLITNVPEFQLRLTVKDKVIRTYRTIVGKPGRTATPQLAETVEGVILNPTWTVPQSIVVGEGLGAKVLGNPSWAKQRGYAASRGANGYVSVVQQPGPTNSLGQVKLDMPNPHAIFLHDTPSRNLFKQDRRALSHGCIRTENAASLALALAMLQADMPVEEGLEKLNSREYTKVAFKRTMPVYITYFTYGRNIQGELQQFGDLYERDAPVLASLAQPRVANRARETDEEVIQIVDDLQDS